MDIRSYWSCVRFDGFVSDGFVGGEFEDVVLALPSVASSRYAIFPALYTGYNL